MWPDAEFPADPYPGAVPPGSFVHVSGHSYPMTSGPSGWVVGGGSLDAWLSGRGAAPVAARGPVLTYGSNRCPSKITWLRSELGLGADPVVVVRVQTRDLAAVWAAGLRTRDGQRPAVLALAPGSTERHAVWLATAEQVTVLDRCEGRGDRYRLARLHSGSVRTEDGTVIERPWCYLGHSGIRRPLLVDGQLVRCTDVAQAAAQHLVGEAAAGDGLDAETVVGGPPPWPPDPAGCAERV
ncbi:gamma-glutamylcyclotransferase [Pseudonocardia sp. GCM10023141]|uniref:gamma-glutamylcyclotransferase n=1 Tax=Pseudonocardia sp. GCM10023141 TaxID=3252653 RepID=UPI00360EAF98